VAGLGPVGPARLVERVEVVGLVALVGLGDLVGMAGLSVRVAKAMFVGGGDGALRHEGAQRALEARAFL